MALTIANKVQQDILAVVADTAEPDQVGAVDWDREDPGRRTVSVAVVDWGREDPGRRTVGAAVVRQDDVEADDSVLAGARQILVQSDGETDDRCVRLLGRCDVSWRPAISLLAFRTVAPCLSQNIRKSTK